MKLELTSEIENSIKEEEGTLIDNKNVFSNCSFGKEEYNDLLTEKSYKIEEPTQNKLFKFFFLFIFFIIILLFAIIITIIYIIYYFVSKPNFKIYHHNWDASYLNDRKYENYVFDNGLEVIIIQDESFDRDGGTIVIEKGYMDNPYNEGIASLATLLLNKIAFKEESEENKKTKLDLYFGQYRYDTETHYTNFRFDILNNGFKKYMYFFSLILNPKNISDLYDLYIEDLKKELDKIYLNYNMKELHLIKYLVFNLTDQEGKDILPEGNAESIQKYGDEELKINVMNYIENLIDPSKIKIVFFSKYKILFTAKYMKKYFSYLTNMKKSNNNKDNEEFKIKTTITSQIFYLKEEDYESNYLEIVYYLDKINNESYIELCYKASYLNYIIDFLNEKKEGSLHYSLTNSSNHNTKRILSGFNIILKSKIEFYIYIELNCLENINNIIFLTYQYMDKIIKEAIGENLQMDRYKELKNKFYQDVKYIDKSFDTIELAKANAEKLFKSQFNLKYFLYIKFVPWDEDEEKIKNESYYYYEQLKPENSIIIIALKDKDKKKISCNESSPFLLDCNYFKDKNNTNFTKYYNVEYINYTFDFNSSYLNINNNANIEFINNTFMTKHNKSFVGPKEKSTITQLENKNIFNKFYFKRNVNFSLPKVYISLNLFHPYLRPMNSDINEKKCYYFKIMEMFYAIKKKINEYLADAIRVGNEISIGENENSLFINIFCYEDAAYKIMEKIKNILIDMDWKSTDFISNNKIYKNEVLEDYFLYDKYYISDISRYYFYTKVKNHLFNKYEFYPEKFEQYYYQDCITDLENELKDLTSFIISGYIYGYYTKEEAQNISNLFEPNYNLEQFISLLDNVNNTEIKDKTRENFLNWVKEIKILNSNDKIDINVSVYNKSDNDSENFGISYIKFNISESELDISLFKTILDKIELGYSLIEVDKFKYENIYFQLLFYKENKSEVIPDSNLLKKEWNYILNNIYQFNNYVDNIGNRYYYLKKNFLSTLYTEQTSLEQRAKDEFQGYLYRGTVIDPGKLLQDYNKKYKGKKFNKNELNDTIKYFSNIAQRIRVDVKTVDN